MNPGAVEETSKVAVSFMDAMKQQPVMLGMVAVMLAMVGLLFFVAHGSREIREKEFEMVFRAQKEVQDLLSRCIVAPPPQRSDFKLQSDENRPVTLPPLRKPEVE